jgi:tRNA threonylcarbamoyladenosine biosynthesis protein TsaB
LLKSLEGTVLFAGEGVSLYNKKIADIFKERALIAPPQTMVPSPANVAMLGLEKAKNGNYADSSAQVPYYIRRSEAEVKWSEKV